MIVAKAHTNLSPYCKKNNIDSNRLINHWCVCNSKACSFLEFTNKIFQGENRIHHFALMSLSWCGHFFQHLFPGRLTSNYLRLPGCPLIKHHHKYFGPIKLIHLPPVGGFGKHMPAVLKGNPNANPQLSCSCNLR